MIDLLILINKNRDTYNLVLVIIDQITKMVYYKFINITKNAIGFAKIIIYIII